MMRTDGKIVNGIHTLFLVGPLAVIMSLHRANEFKSLLAS